VIRVEDKSKLVTRLHIVNGHVASIVRMMESGRPAEEVLRQLAAVQASLAQINLLVYNQEVNAFASKMRNQATDQERWLAAQRLLNIFRIQSH
jgi:DNA-binding FrmR family transcriptional regulator